MYLWECAASESAEAGLRAARPCERCNCPPVAMEKSLRAACRSAASWGRSAAPPAFSARFWRPSRSARHLLQQTPSRCWRRWRSWQWWRRPSPKVSADSDRAHRHPPPRLEPQQPRAVPASPARVKVQPLPPPSSGCRGGCGAASFACQRDMQDPAFVPLVMCECDLIGSGAATDGNSQAKEKKKKVNGTTLAIHLRVERGCTEFADDPCLCTKVMLSTSNTQLTW